MSYQEVYKQKLTTADEAVKAVKSGDWARNSYRDKAAVLQMFLSGSSNFPPCQASYN